MWLQPVGRSQPDQLQLKADITRPWSRHLAVSETEDPTTALVALKRCGEVKFFVKFGEISFLGHKKVVKVVRESGAQNGPKHSGEGFINCVDCFYFWKVERDWTFFPFSGSLVVVGMNMFVYLILCVYIHSSCF